MHRFSIVVHWKGLLFHKKHVTLTKQEIRGDLMKEKIYTIPVNEAFETHDECPFCHLERDTEQRAIKYVLGPGASYMEPEVRLATDKAGFCREHYKKMFDFGNHLGSALIMQTYFVSMFEEMVHEMENFQQPGKRGLFSKKNNPGENNLVAWARKKQSSCYICDKLEYNMGRYYSTFCYLTKEAEFRQKVENSKGFCMRHFLALLEVTLNELPNDQQQWFYEKIFTLMRENLSRVKDDLDWFVDKFDYRNAGADWKNSQDAVPRTMQKLCGTYPADPPFTSEPR